jgi:hypothetical protein
MTDKKLPSKKSSRAAAKKSGGRARGQKVRKLGKDLSKEIGKHIKQLTSEHKKPGVTKEKKEAIDLKLQTLKEFKGYLDDLAGCPPDAVMPFGR